MSKAKGSLPTPATLWALGLPWSLLICFGEELLLLSCRTGEEDVLFIAPFGVAEDDDSLF